MKYLDEVYEKVNKHKTYSSAGAASQCYWDEIMLFKCELMLLKSQINTNTKKKDFASYQMFRKGIEILILSFNYFILSIS